MLLLPGGFWFSWSSPKRSHLEENWQSIYGPYGALSLVCQSDCIFRALFRGRPHGYFSKMWFQAHDVSAPRTTVGKDCVSAVLQQKKRARSFFCIYNIHSSIHMQKICSVFSRCFFHEHSQPKVSKPTAHYLLSCGHREATQSFMAHFYWHKREHVTEYVLDILWAYSRSF